jgi:hypothetical protein
VASPSMDFCALSVANLLNSTPYSSRWMRLVPQRAVVCAMKRRLAWVRK